MDENSSLFLEIRVACGEALSVKGRQMSVVMIPFTGVSEGPYFFGKTLGTGVDTQKIGKDGSFLLSARYMLEGQDASGNACRIFIENQGEWGAELMPKIVTDSQLLARWEDADLYATAEGIPGGVIIRIFSRGE